MIDYEARVQQVYEAVLRPGMGAIDVGAHVGRHGLEMLKRVTPGGYVMMFEPLPDLYAKLLSHVHSDPVLERHAEVYPYALSDHSGQTEFCISVDAIWFSGILERKFDVPTEVKRIEVPVRRLDDLVGAMKSVDYIKIDTEGAEWDVLKGAADTIARHRPVITFEFGENSYGAYGVDPAEVFRFFAGKSYVLRDILGRELDEGAFCSSSARQEVWDYIAVPDEKSGALQLQPGP